MKSSRITALVCTAAILAGCSAQNSLPIAGANAGATAAHPIRHHRKGVLRIRIRIPRRHHHRRPGWVSPNTLGATLAFTGAQNLTVSIGLTPSANPNGCATVSNVTTCTITLRLLVGSYTAAISTYDEAPVSGTIPGGANLLSRASNLPLTIQLGVANSANFTLDGVVASLAVSGVPSGTLGTAFGSPQALTVVAKDAHGNIITGTYDNPVTLSDSDVSGHSTVATSGGDSPPTGQLLSSSDAATFDYDGTPAFASAIVTAAASGATSGQATFSPVPVLTSITISTGKVGGTVSETATGDFAPGATTLSGTGLLPVPGTVTATGTQITATLLVDPHTASGTTSLIATTTAGEASTGQTFTVSSTNVDVVTLGTDTKATDGNGVVGNGSGSAGDLRYTMLNAAAGDTIVFDTVAICSATDGTGPCTITLAGPLPPIQQNQTIDGSYFVGGTPRVTIDGNSKYRAFWVDTGTVALNNLQIQNVLAQGGNGGNSEAAGGGGGAGLGGGLFVNQATGSTSVSVTNDYFYSCQAVGGNGGNATGGVTGIGGAGGGGLGGSGGAAATSFGGSGGGGVLGVGAVNNATGGGNGGFGGGGGGSPDSASTAVGTGGSGYAGNPAGSDGNASSPGGAGALGGGGGGGGWGSSAGFAGGAGGLGGGGGGGGSSLSAGGNGGNGGAGAGGGGSSFAATAGTPGTGGTLIGIKGGNGANYYGGGGAAAGPAIFVASGALTTTNSGASNCSVTAGLGGGAGTFEGEVAFTPVFNYAGTVNGSGTTGGIPSALGSSAPALRVRRGNVHDRRKAAHPRG